MIGVAAGPRTARMFREIAAIDVPAAPNAATRAMGRSAKMPIAMPETHPAAGKIRCTAARTTLSMPRH